MISEKLLLDFDFESLKNEFLEIRKNFTPVMITEKFGGWSITSSTGSYQDGWITGEEFANDKAGAEFDLDRLLEKKKFKSIREYRKPTECCKENADKLIKKLDDLGLFPCRARYMLLKAGGETNYHRDCPESVYAVRLHIPIITNSECFFLTENGKQHLETQSAYLLKVNRLHQVMNHGNDDRVHLICDVYDTKNVSQFHQLTEKDIEYFKSRRKS